MSHLRILLAEDDELNQKVTLAMLNRLGHKADTANNGIEVLCALEDRRYDLILMNIGMPLLDGLETTFEIRRRWKNGPRIVAITARVLPEMKENASKLVWTIMLPSLCNSKSLPRSQEVQLGRVLSGSDGDGLRGDGICFPDGMKPNRFRGPNGISHS